MSTGTTPIPQPPTNDESRLPIPRTVRIFISSPGDVRPERLAAQRLIEKLAREFSYHLRVEPVLWEREPLIATGHFQSSITSPRETDIVVVILWSRLGVPLPADQFPGPVTGRPVTGTEWEFEDAFATYRERGRPALLLYRKTAEVTGSLHDKADVLRQLQQMELVDDFVRRWLVDPEAQTFKLAFRDFATSTAFEEMLEEHLRALLEKMLDGSEAAAGDVPRWHEGSPFRGLQSFELEHAPIFFGRTRARNEVRELLARRAGAGCAFVLVLGASGSGKSSVVKAGLLADARLPGMIGRVALCRYAVLRPADVIGDLLVGLAAALLAPAALPELDVLRYDRARLAELLRQHSPALLKPLLEEALSRAAKAAQLTEQAEARVLLIVDQFEELFTLERLTTAERTAFVATLDALARSGLVWVVATMRSDFFDRLEQVPELAQLASTESRYLLTLPDASELAQIVRAPAREAGLRFEADRTRGIGLDDELCRVAYQSPSALPLLEFTLDQLWQRRTPTGELTFAAYHELGGLEGALGRRAEEEFSNLHDVVRDGLPLVLRSLATAGPGSRGAVTARAARLDSFGFGSPQRKLVEAFLAPEARLLVADGDQEGVRVRVAHEALLTHWERARNHLAHDRADLQTRTRLEQAAMLWQTAPAPERASRLLPIGLPLAEAQDLVERRRDELDAAIVEYTEASTAAAQAQAQRSRRRLRTWAAGLALLALLAGITAIVAYQQRRTAERERDIAVSQRLAGQATLLANGGGGAASTERAADLAVESWKRQHNAEATEAARKLVDMLPAARIAHGGPVAKVVFSPSGKLLATASDDKTARLVDTSTGKEVARLEHGGKVTEIAFSPDGRFLATASNDKTVRLMDTAKGKEVGRMDLGWAADGLVFSADSRFLAASAYENTARFLDTANGRVTRIEHGGIVREIVFSPDSRLLATASDDHTARLVEAASGKELARIEQGGRVFLIAFSPDSRLLATASGDTNKEETASGDHSMRLVDTATGKQVARIDHGKAVRAIAFSPNSRLVASASDDRMARLVDTATGKSAGRIEHGERVRSVAFSPDSRYLATTSYDKTARLIDASSGKEIARINHDGSVEGIAFSPDSRFLATASEDNTSKIVEIGTGKEVIRIEHPGAVRNIQFSPDSRFFATDSEGYSALRDMAAGKELARIAGRGRSRFSPDSRFLAVTLANEPTAWLVETARGTLIPVEHQFAVRSMAFSDDSRFLATASYDGMARLLETPSGYLRPIVHGGSVTRVVFGPGSRLLATVSVDRMVRLIDSTTGNEVSRVEHDSMVTCIAISPNARFLATGSNRGTARLIDLSNGKEIARIDHRDTVRKVIFSLDSRYLATTGDDNTVRLIDTASGRQLARQYGLAQAAAFSPDSRLLATEGGDQTVLLMDTASGREASRIKNTEAIDRVLFSPNGRFLAVACQDNGVRIVEIPNGNEVAHLQQGHATSSLAFSPDGRFLATASDDNTARLLKLASGKEVARIQHGDSVQQIAFSPDSQFLATASEDHTARLLSVKSGKEVLRVDHGGTVTSIAFSPDSRFLATASADRTARLLEIASGGEVARVEHNGPVRDLAFSPDGRLLATASEDGTARMMWADPQHIFDVLCLRAGRNLTREEWNTNIGAGAPKASCPGWRNEVKPAVKK